MAAFVHAAAAALALETLTVGDGRQVPCYPGVQIRRMPTPRPERDGLEWFPHRLTRVVPYDPEDDPGSRLLRRDLDDVTPIH